MKTLNNYILEKLVITKNLSADPLDYDEVFVAIMDFLNENDFWKWSSKHEMVDWRDLLGFTHPDDNKKPLRIHDFCDHFKLFTRLADDLESDEETVKNFIEENDEKLTIDIIDSLDD